MGAWTGPPRCNGITNFVGHCRGKVGEGDPHDVLVSHRISRPLGCREIEPGATGVMERQASASHVGIHLLDKLASVSLIEISGGPQRDIQPVGKMHVPPHNPGEVA